jgi:S-adenosylmethionine synthetase
VARYIAKNIVAAGLARECEVQLSYAIGYPDPLNIWVNANGTAKIPETSLVDLIREHFKLTPKGIIESLNLRRPVYRETARHGHFGRKGAGFTWEKTDKAEALKRDAGVGQQAEPVSS